MKRILIAATALGLMAGPAVAMDEMAEGPALSFSGSAGMALTYMGQVKDGATITHESEMTFNHFVKIGIAGSGTTDGGLTFGADVRINTTKVDEADVFIGGDMWTLTVGTPDRASDLGFGIDDVGWDGNLGVDDVAEGVGKSTGDHQARFDLKLGSTTLGFSVATTEATPYTKKVDGTKYTIPAQTVTVKGGTFAVAGTEVKLPSFSGNIKSEDGIAVTGTEVKLPSYTGTLAGGGTVTIPAVDGTWKIGTGDAAYEASAPTERAFLEGYVRSSNFDGSGKSITIDNDNAFIITNNAGVVTYASKKTDDFGAPISCDFGVNTCAGFAGTSPKDIYGLKYEGGEWLDTLDGNAEVPAGARKTAAENYRAHFNLGSDNTIGGENEASDLPETDYDDRKAADTLTDAGKTNLLASYEELAGLKRVIATDVDQVSQSQAAREGTLDGDASVTVNPDGQVQVTQGTVIIDGVDVDVTADAGATVTQGSVTIKNQDVEIPKQEIVVGAVEAIMAQSQKTHWGIGVKSELGPVTLGLGADSNDALMFSVGGSRDGFGGSFFYGRRSMDEGEDVTSMGAEGTFSAGASTSINVVYAQSETGSAKADGFGVGVTHDLGGKAKVQAGLASVNDRDKFSAGVTMEF